MTNGNFRHYYLMPDKGIVMKQAATSALCIPYLIQRDDKDVLCVIEGDAFHTFDVSPASLARLAYETTSRLRSLIAVAI